MDVWLDRYPRLAILLPVATAIAVGLFYLRVVAHFEYTPDDTYIYLRTAVHLAEGEGWAFNPGDASYAVTGPLWAALIAGGSAVGLDPFIVAKSLDATMAALAVLALQLLVFSVTEDRVMSALAAIMATFDASLLRWAGSGMETSLAILLTILVVRYVVDDEWLIAGAALGLLILVRPEYALLAPWLVISTREAPWGAHLRRWAAPLAISAGIAAAWWATATIWTGTPLPSTVSSKAGWWLDPSRTATALFESARIIGATHVVPALVVGVLAFLIPRGTDPVRMRWWRVLAGWPVVLCVAYAVQGVQVVSRYLAPASIFLTAAMMLAISIWLDARPWRWRAASAIALVAAVLTIGINTAVYELRVAPHLRDFTTGMQQAVKPIAFWLRTHAHPEDEVLAPDIGMVGYISERRVWDPAGLATPALRKAIAGYTYDEVMEQRLYRAVVDPRFVIDRSRVRERLADATFRPRITAEMPGLGVSIPGTQYVTLYEVVR